MENILAGVLLTVLVGNLAISLLYPLLVVLLNYVFRSHLVLDAFENWKEEVTGNSDFVGVQVMSYFVVFVACFLGAIVVKGNTNLTGFGECMFESFSYVSSFALLVASLPFLRWLVDISRNLKIKSSTGDSEKLKDLQNQIDQLKNK